MIREVGAYEIDTPHGPARLHVDGSDPTFGVLVLGHGAGGGVAAPDLLGAQDAADRAVVTVVRVEQPYRVAGRRPAAPAAQLDAAWAAVVAHVHERWPGTPQIHGGRSSGARVACRGAVGVAPELRPAAVLALAFPLLAPARKDGTRADRGPEIDAVAAAGIPTLAVSGARDRFGVPEAVTGREVVVLPGDHSLRARRAVAEVVGPWLRRIVGGPPPGAPLA